MQYNGVDKNHNSTSISCIIDLNLPSETNIYYAEFNDMYRG